MRCGKKLNYLSYAGGDSGSKEMQTGSMVEPMVGTGGSLDSGGGF